MVSQQLCIILLSVSLSGKTLSTSIVSAVQPAKKSNLIEHSKDASNDIQRLESSITELRNEIEARRCESGFMGFTPHTQPSVQWPDGVKRIHSIHLHFSRPFATKPWVSVGIIHLDVYNYANLRIDIKVDAISTSGFDAHAYEWADTHNVFVNVSWVACNI